MEEYIITSDAMETIEEAMNTKFSLDRLIRCRDCKNSEHWYRDRRKCYLWSETGASVFDDGFCNYAEKKTD